MERKAQSRGRKSSDRWPSRGHLPGGDAVTQRPCSSPTIVDSDGHSGCNAPAADIRYSIHVYCRRLHHRDLPLLVSVIA